MGNQELLDHFKSYAALKARHSYGPQGHRGMSVLIFDDTTAGYLEAARLHKHFKEQGRDREAWKSNRFPFCSGGKRQLYGYMALKEDLNFFNQHSQGPLSIFTPHFCVFVSVIMQVSQFYSAHIFSLRWIKIYVHRP